MKLSEDQEAIEYAGLLRQSSVLCMPTGSGKTWLARRAIHGALDRGLKAIYVSPLRAIAREVSVAWAGEFPDHRLGVYTGEMGLDEGADQPTPAEADILIATPEKLDLYVRSWSDNLAWLAQVDMVIVDELHTLGGGRRGATLEGMLTRLRTINPYTNVIGLSATLGNPHELAKWLGGKAYESRKRLVPLSWRIRTHSKAESKADVVIDEAARTINGGGQAIVFVQSRPRTESLVKKMGEAGIAAVAHHAGLSKAARDKAERQYRSGEVKILIATPTVSQGVNLPAKQVLLHDLQRWGSDGWVDLDTNEIWQLGGRAGRLGLDAAGEVVLVAPVWNQKAARGYMKGDFEDIESQLSQQAAFEEQLLVCFGSRMALKPAQAERVLAASFGGRSWSRGDLTKRINDTLEQMIDAGMLDRNEDGCVRATRLGRIATRFQLTGKTVLGWRKFEELVQGAKMFDVLLAVCSSSDFTARLRVDHQEVPVLQEALNKEPMDLRGLSQAVRNSVIGCSGRDLIGSVKTALVLRAWTRLGSIEEVGLVFDCMEHEVEEARKECVRLLQAMSAMLGSEPKDELRQADDVTWREKVSALSAMVCAGLDDEQATLALIDGVGPVMARRLAAAGLKDIEDLAQSSPEDVVKTEGVSLKRAARWVEEAGKLVNGGGAFRYKEVCKAAENSSLESAVFERGLDYYRWARASSLTVRESEEGWTVEGGSEQHRVVKSSGAYVCDCADSKKGRLCKHRIAVMHVNGEEGIPRFEDGFPDGDGRMDLELEWRASAYGAQSRWR